MYKRQATWKAALWEGGDFGQGRLAGNLGWTRGERVSNGQDLYHIMPLHTRVALEQNKGAWSNAVELQLVNKKTRVDEVRLEPKTAGYGLLNLRTSYQWKHVQFDAAVNNLFDKYYELPLGGVNYATWNAAGGMGAIGALPGLGRSVNVGFTLKY